MKKVFFLIIWCIVTVFSIHAQTSFKQEITGFYAYGLAGDDQVIDDTKYGPGIFSDKKNAYYVKGNVEIKSSFGTYFDLFMKLNTTSRPGAPYLPLQISNTSQKDFEISVDALYGQMQIFKGLLSLINGDLPEILFYLKAGYYDIKASDLKVSRYGTESVLNMIKTSTSPGISLILSYLFTDPDQIYQDKSATFMIEAAANGLFDEAVERLYDIDGTYSHGDPVDDEYAPQFFASIRLLDYVLPFGILSADASYAYNGAGFYSGHSAGASARLDTQVYKEKLYLPLSLSFAFYEKNIDSLGTTADTGFLKTFHDDGSIDFRNTIRAGLALGARYIGDEFKNNNNIFPAQVMADLSIGTSFTYLQHYYRNPLSLVGVSIDGRLTLNKSIFLGGGFILGTITDVEWKSNDPVKDDYEHIFNPHENMGYEISFGFEEPDVGSLSIGFTQNKGLAMAYGVDSVKDGLIKYKQAGTDMADELLETCGIFVKITGKF